MARRRRRGGLGEARRDPDKVNRAAWRMNGRMKTVPVEVTLNRTALGRYTAMACARSRKKVRGARSWKGAHCGELSAGPTPTKASAAALKSLGDALARIRVR